MKYFVPEINISIDDGFTRELDIFNRKSVGESLANLFKHSDQSLVVAIDNKWGEGKSTFLKMWRGHLKNNHDIESIYFDAFTNDHVEDPFSALLGELYSFIEDKLPDDSLNKMEFKDKAKKAGISVLKGGLKVAIRYATINAFDGTFLDGNNQDSNKTDKAIADELSNLSESAVQNYLSSYNNAKNEIEDFQKILTKVVEEISPNTPLIFIVDELDRCRPSYSVELLEKLKHVFSVPRVHFVLSMNIEQLEASVKGVYGEAIKSCLYIQKFIHFSLTLPMITEYSVSFQGRYIDELAIRCDFENNARTAKIKNLFIELATHKNLSFRDCEKIFTVLLIQYGAGNKSWPEYLVPLAYFKVLVPDLFEKTINGKAQLSNFEKALNADESNYDELTGSLKMLYLQWCIRFRVKVTNQPETEFEKNYRLEVAKSSSKGDMSGVFKQICNDFSNFNFSFAV